MQTTTIKVNGVELTIPVGSTVEINGMTITIQVAPTTVVVSEPSEQQVTNLERTYGPAARANGDSYVPAYSHKLAMIFRKAEQLLQEDWTPNAVGEILWDELIGELQTDEHFADGECMSENEYEQAISNTAAAFEDVANALADLDALVNIGYLSRRKI